MRERDQVQRLQARTTEVAEAFKTGDAEQEIREEIQEALQSLNLRLRQLVERVQSSTGGNAQTPPPCAGSEASAARR